MPVGFVAILLVVTGITCLELGAWRQRREDTITSRGPRLPHRDRRGPWTSQPTGVVVHHRPRFFDQDHQFHQQEGTP